MIRVTDTIVLDDTEVSERFVRATNTSRSPWTSSNLPRSATRPQQADAKWRRNAEEIADSGGQRLVQAV
jgi:hypothetical protein